MNKRLIKILVNLITTSRLIFAIVLICLFRKINNNIYLIIMLGLYATDFIDGYLARKYKVQTFYGGIMDTFADKTLNIALIVPLLKEIPLMFTLIMLEVIIMVINIIARITGKQTKSKKLGKIKMWVIAIAILLGYLEIFNILKTNYLLNTIILFTAIIQILVTIDYIIYIKNQKTKNKIIIKNKIDLMYILFDTEYYLKNCE